MGCGASKAPDPMHEPQPVSSSAVKELSTPLPEPKRRGSYQSPEMTALEGTAMMAELPLPEHRVGTWSNHGIKPGISGKPSAKINQDRGQITYPFAGDRRMAMFCVYDGHGVNGEQVSEFAMLKMPDLLEAEPERVHSDTSNLLIEAFERTDKELRESSIASAVSGSTGVVVLLTPTKIWTANVGDSRAVLARRSAPGSDTLVSVGLTEDQKPDTPAEMKRILAAGGYVSPESAQHGPARVWLRAGEGPGLAMARSLGDHMCSHVGVIASPEVKTFDCTELDHFMILASDGVWEFITNEEAVAIVSKHRHARDGCTALINEATLRWRKEEGNYRDDITCIVVHLPVLPDESANPVAEEYVAPQASPLAVDDEQDQLAGEQSSGNFVARRLTLAQDPNEGDAAALAALLEAHPEKDPDVEPAYGAAEAPAAAPAAAYESRLTAAADATPPPAE